MQAMPKNVYVFIVDGPPIRGFTSATGGLGKSIFIWNSYCDCNRIGHCTYTFLSVIAGLVVVISSTFKCVMNLNRICNSGRNFRITLSDSIFSMSPTNMYFMWYLRQTKTNRFIKTKLRSTRRRWLGWFAYNKSQMESMYLSGASPRFLSTCSNISYNVVVISYPTRGRSWSNRSINGPNKWQT